MTLSDTIQSHILIYHPAVLSLVVLCLAVLIQSFLGGILGYASGKEVPGMPLKGSHSELSFRAIRTYANSIESLPLFAITLILAVAVGAAPIWVNVLAITHVLLRLAYWFIYYKGVGVPAGGPRTIVFVIGWFANLLLCVVALLALI